MSLVQYILCCILFKMPLLLSLIAMCFLSFVIGTPSLFTRTLSGMEMSKSTTQSIFIAMSSEITFLHPVLTTLVHSIADHDLARYQLHFWRQSCYILIKITPGNGLKNVSFQFLWLYFSPSWKCHLVLWYDTRAPFSAWLFEPPPKWSFL